MIVIMARTGNLEEEKTSQSQSVLAIGCECTVSLRSRLMGRCECEAATTVVGGFSLHTQTPPPTPASVMLWGARVHYTAGWVWRVDAGL